jgi:3-deoxy-manno-octulosonate cytidylyltransferase (CMP-KDO synthetase)
MRTRRGLAAVGVQPQVVVVRFVVPPASLQSAHGANPPTAVVAVIPARYASTRLPGKPLALIGERPMIEHVYRRVAATPSIGTVLVATDDERVRAVVERFGGRAVLTAATHASGTDRVAEVAARLDCELVVNVQGDEPLIEPAMIEEALAPFADDPALPMSTLCRRLEDPARAASPHVTKVVFDRTGHALYFSRAPIPFVREGGPGAVRYEHVGLYVYRRACLLALAKLDPTPLEQAEQLEQLRALEHGVRIRVVETAHRSIGVDTPEDLERVRQLVASRG